MSTKLGTLTLDLVTKIGNFVGPIKDGEKQVKVSFDNMRQHINTYGAALAAMGAGAVTALAGMAYSTSEQAVELEKFAFRANTTTQEFQKMAAGAGAFGIEQDKLSDMMKDFNEKLGELTAIGAGGGVDFFEQIAMKTEGSSEAAQQLILDMQKLSGPEALQMYVNKLEEAGVTQQQMSFYLESMASDLTDLYPLLANGGEGLKLYGDMAERAGFIMKDQTIESAKALKDQVYMLDLQMQGAKNQLMQAVIPAFVDIAEAFLGSSEQGVQFEEVAEGIAKTLKVLASVAIGAVTAIQLVGKALGGLAAIGGAVYDEMDWYEMNPLGIVKAAYEARGEIAALTTEIKGDMHQTIMGAADRLDKMWSSGASKKAEQLRGVRELGESVHNTNSGLSELADKQDKATKSTTKNTSAIRDQNRAYEEAQRLVYEYGSEFNRIDMDLSDERGRINNSALKVGSKIKMIADAQEISDARKKIYTTELDFELNQYHMTELEKLKAQLSIDLLKLDATKGLLDSERKLKKDALVKQAATEESALKISQQKQLLETKRNWISAAEYAQEYYALVREEILNTANYSPEMKDALLQQSQYQQNSEQADERDNAIADYRNVMGFDESPLVQQYKVLDKMRELDLISEEKYQQDKLQLQAQSTASYMEGMFSGFASMVDENSKTYAVLFATQKAFAVAQALLNVPSAYSKAYDAVVGTPYIGPYIAPVVGAAAAALQVAQAAQIKGVNLTGMAHNGIDNVPAEGTWLLDKGERVLSSKQNKDFTKYLESQGDLGGRSPITINNSSGAQVSAQHNSDGSITIDMVDQMIKRSWSQLGNANSRESKAVTRNTTAKRAR